LVDPVPAVRRLRAAVPVGVEQALTEGHSPKSRRPVGIGPRLRRGARRPAAPAGPRPPSVAVLPFLNLSADPENEYFADGITEDVIAHLSKIRALKVISRTSVMAFKQRSRAYGRIGARLEVATLLEGSVRRAGDRVRIVAQLIDAESDRHLWVETYDRRLTDVFAIQTDVALQIAAALKAELSPDEKSRLHHEPTSDLQAYQLYLQGRHCYLRYTAEGSRRGIEYFEQAIAKDPTTPWRTPPSPWPIRSSPRPARCAGRGLRPSQGREREGAGPRRGARRGALHARLHHGGPATSIGWPPSKSSNAPLELTPNSADTYDLYGRMCLALERNDEALAMERRAQELDPLATGRTSRGRCCGRTVRTRLFRRRHRAVELDPHYARAHATLGWAYLKKASRSRAWRN